MANPTPPRFFPPPRPVPIRGGPEPVHQEVVIGGPFLGFDTDSSNWYKKRPGILQDCENVDFLKGQMRMRPGITIAQAAGTSVTAGTIRNISSWEQSTTEARFDDDLAAGSPSHIRRYRADVGSYPFVASDWNWWRNLTRIVDLPTLFFDTFSKVGNAVFQQAVGATWRTVDFNAAAVTMTPAGANPTDLLVDFFVGSYVHVHTNNELPGGTVPLFYRCTRQSVNDTGSPWSLGTLTVTPANAGNAEVAEELYLIPPLRGINGTAWQVASETAAGNYNVNLPDLSNNSCITRMPGTDQYYCGGWFGGAYVDFGNLDNVAGIWQTDTQGYQTPGNVRYAARASAYYNNRLVLGTPYSVSFRTGEGAGATNAYDWRLNTHKGRIAYSMNGAPRDFAGLGSGEFNLEIGDVYQFVLLRDILYAIGENGIASIQKTGNSYQPFRAQTVIPSDQFVDAVPIIVDGAYAIIHTTSGPVRFDGGPPQKLGEGIAEIFRGMYKTFSGAYDYTRNRSIFTYRPADGTGGATSGEKILLIDRDSGTATRYAATSATWTSIYETVPWTSSVSSEQVIECSFLSDMGLLKMSRSATADSGTLSWYATTPVFDADNSRDLKTLDKIRVTYEDRAAATGTQNRIFCDVTMVNETTVTTTTLNLDLTGDNSGEVKQLYVPIAPLTGQQFYIKLYSDTNNRKVVLNEVRLYFIMRQERHPG